MESLEQQVAYSATLPRTCVKQYRVKAAESSSIDGTYMIVFKYPFRDVHKAPSTFPFLTVRTKFCSAGEVAQLDASVVVNMKVNVKEVHPPQNISGLVKRCCDCSSGYCDFKIEVLGEWPRQEVLRLLIWRL